MLSARIKLPAIILLAGFSITPAQIAASSSNSSEMPKPAPPIQLQIQNSASTSVSVSGSASAIPSFRVQTDSSSSQAAEPANNPALSGLIPSIIKTNPSRAGEPSPVPPEIFRAWLEQAHPQFALSCSSMSPQNVLEVKGIYDNSSRTLRSLGIPFSQIRGGGLVDAPLADVKVRVVNCPGRVPQEAFQKLRDFVARGGYLLTTDWSSDNLVERAFPGYIQWDRHSNKQAVYDAEIVNPDPSLFARTVTNASWKMDIDSHMIRTLRNDVRVLAASKQLAGEDTASHGALAVVFPFGRGYVMHMVAHFDNNTILPFRNMLADPAPVIGVSLRQVLAANFVVAGLSNIRIPLH